MNDILLSWLTVRWVALVIALAAGACGPSSSADPMNSTVAADSAAADSADSAAREDTNGADDVGVDADSADAADVLDSVDSADSSDVLEPGPWRSALYPDDWTPNDVSTDGWWLPDFSYAGYRGGEALPAAAADDLIFDVTDYGADGSAGGDNTAAIQAAIDAASAAAVTGQQRRVVSIPAGLYRCDGSLKISASNVILRGAGSALSRLHFTAHQGMSYKAHLTAAGAPTVGVERSLTQDGVPRSHEVRVADASGLAVGDDVALGWIISAEFRAEHGMEGTWEAFNDTWQPIFLREIVAIEPSNEPSEGDGGPGGPATITLDVPLRYPAKVRDGASLKSMTGYLSEVGVEGLGFADAVSWDAAWAQKQVHVLSFAGVVDSWVRDVASFVSPAAPESGKGAERHLQSGGVIVRGSKRVTVTDSTMALAQNRGGGGNGYLFEVRTSNEILFRDCVARAGRHGFIQNWGFGATGIVWLRPWSLEGTVEQSKDQALATVGHSEFHHSLAMANLIDGARIDDGWSAVNRKQWSSGAGHTSTGSVFWNARGAGTLRSYQYDRGYVIGTDQNLSLKVIVEPPPAGIPPETWDLLGAWEGGGPDDWLEGQGRGSDLQPASLYEDQRARRLSP